MLDFIYGQLEYAHLLIEVLLSILLGFFIGLERKMRSKEAGIRTHTIVCFGSALMMVVSKYAFDDNADTARVAAQIVSGVGFLGAGMIVFKKHEVHGLTTAAGVWATAGIGMACGGGLYLLAIGSTIMLLSVQLLFHSKIKFFAHKKYYSIRIQFVHTEHSNERIKKLFDVDKFNRLVIERQGDVVMYKATLYTDVEFSSTRLDEIMSDNPFIILLERCDNE